jgi:hypothetical protein
VIKLGFDGGDGDQTYFGEPFVATCVEEDWFPKRLERGPAWLVRILDGRHCGEYLALTSRVQASLEDQLAIRDMLSVVVQRVKEPGPGLKETEGTMPAIGMAAVDVLDRKTTREHLSSFL